MCPFDYLSDQPVKPVKKGGSPTPDDEAITRFLSHSAHYFNLPAERLHTISKQKHNTPLKSRHDKDYNFK